MTIQRLKKAARRIYRMHPLESIALLAGLVILVVLVFTACLFPLFRKPKEPDAEKPSPTPTQAQAQVVASPTISLPLPTPTPTPSDFVYVPGECSSVTADPNFTLIDEDDWEIDPLMLVNWEHYLTYSGEPENLVYLKDYLTDPRYQIVDPSTARGNLSAVIALNQMCLDAMNAGCSNVKFSATGTYRTYETQDGFWQKHISEDPNYGADPYMNPPRTVPAACSEHRTGLGFDIWMVEYDYEWLHENSYKYGFIVRYPSSKIGYTGIMYEQWHFRYVGIEAATEMYEKGMCLEEYIAYRNGVTITPHPTASPTPTPKPNEPTKVPTKAPTPTPGKLPSVTPEVPSVSPEPSPSVSPELSPSISPEPFPSISPEPSPSETPGPTEAPEISVTPEPTEPTEPTPEPSPETNAAE